MSKRLLSYPKIMPPSFTFNPFSVIHIHTLRPWTKENHYHVYFIGLYRSLDSCLPWFPVEEGTLIWGPPRRSLSRDTDVPLQHHFTLNTISHKSVCPGLYHGKSRVSDGSTTTLLRSTSLRLTSSSPDFRFLLSV